MRSVDLARQHWAALRALLVFTVILGVGYPLAIWLIAQLPWLHFRAEGSIITAGDRPIASALIGQSFTDAAGNPLPQYFQGRPSAGGYDPAATGGSNLGPEDVVDRPGRISLLTQVCARSIAIERTEGLAKGAGARPFCTDTGVGAVLSVLGPRDPHGNVVHPTRAISINEPCPARPFLSGYRGVPVECATPGDDYSAGQIVPVRGPAPAHPAVPSDAVTGSGSGLDPDISPAYADLQIARVAKARHVDAARVRELVDKHRRGRELGFLGEPRVNVVALNAELDQMYPAGHRN